jgi:hypothetical protein
VDITARSEGFFAPDLVEEAGVTARALPGGDHTLSLAGSTGVLKAELIDNSHSGDPRYDEVAISARNAVLASSPLALPTGQYDDVMDMIIYMNPRDTLH